MGFKTRRDQETGRLGALRVIFGGSWWGGKFYNYHFITSDMTRGIETVDDP